MFMDSDVLSLWGDSLEGEEWKRLELVKVIEF